ncbi:PREDICTED: pathogenesis-related [Prunus dulcis]|uniref:PREDICTED: pathogenesis-related n=1 Tax=Prunus dulcis TaxID=3755 RepID=A0A5E4G4N4_PRUDU|nr:PREDICTED: pathogenesis-related [Prunus dulcis]
MGLCKNSFALVFLLGLTPSPTNSGLQRLTTRLPQYPNPQNSPPCYSNSSAQGYHKSHHSQDSPPQNYHMSQHSQDSPPQNYLNSPQQNYHDSHNSQDSPPQINHNYHNSRLSQSQNYQNWQPRAYPKNANQDEQVGVPPLTWDPNVAAHVQRYPDSRIGDYNLVHSSGPYGENIAMRSRDLSVTAAVNMFVSKKSSYHYNSNSCAPGKVCGHYTQVVWRNSVRLGCAKARCNNGGTFIGCNYDPPGNYNGRSPH